MKSLVTCLACLGLCACFAAPGGSRPTTSASIGPEGGQIGSADGNLTLRVPAGALEKAVTITVAPSAEGPLPAQAVALGGAYAIGPASLNLEVPAEVTLAVSSTAHDDGEALGVFEAGDGEVSLVALPTTVNADGTISAAISGPGDVQAARYVLLNPTTGGSGGTTSVVTNSGSTSGGTVAGSSSGSTTGGGTSTGSTGQSSYCGGAAGTTGGPGQLQGCQLISQYCSGSAQDEVDCTQGNCRCLRQGQQFAWVQEPANDCAQAWRDCGLPPSPVVNGGGAGTTGGGQSLGGAATVQGAVAFSAQADSFTTPSGSAPYALEVSLAQNGLCGGFDATGLSMFIGLTSDSPIAPGTYPVGGRQVQPGTALIAVSDWDDDAGAYGVLGYSTDGTFTLDAYDGGWVSGSFDANFDLGGGALSAISGSFSAVPACTR